MFVSLPLFREMAYIFGGFNACSVPFVNNLLDKKKVSHRASKNCSCNTVKDPRQISKWTRLLSLEDHLSSLPRFVLANYIPNCCTGYISEQTPTLFSPSVTDEMGPFCRGACVSNYRWVHPPYVGFRQIFIK